MKFFFLFLVFTFHIEYLLAQKPPIDSLAVANWPIMGYNPAISNNGDYFFYSIYSKQSETLVVQSTRNTWKKEFPGVRGGIFTRDSKQLIFKRKDTLFFCL